MAKKNKTHVSEVLENTDVLEGCNNTSNLDEIEKIEAELLVVDTRACEIVGITPKGLHVQFDNYGVFVPVKNIDQYSGRKKIRVSYSGKIGTADFKAWIA